jgi:GT2 family glycosyltransferase
LGEPGRSIAVVIPTLDKVKGKDTGKLALATAGCSVPVRVLISYDSKGQGFTKTANQGIRAADDIEDICLLNDDVLEFQYGWLEILRKVLYSNERYGLSGPSGACGAAPMNTGRRGQVGFEVVKQISFWCVLMKREMLNQLGLLDPAFIHYCSDNWYCHLMRQRGWKCVWVKAVFLVHRKHGSGMQSKWRAHDRKEYFRRLR